MSALPLFDGYVMEIAGVPHETRWSVDDITVSRHKGNPQSEAAHEAVRPNKTKQHGEILSELAIAGAHGRTCEEISRRLSMAYTSASARLSELKRSGDVIESGERRPTNSLCMAAVVVLKQFAKEVRIEE